MSTGKVLMVFRNLPLEQIHPNAMPAAKAAYCAGQQSPAWFWGMHDWLFATQSGWSPAKDGADQFRKQAVALGADGAKYDACLSDAKTAAAFQKEMLEGAQAGVQGTPAFFVNDWFLNGAVPFPEFQKTIDKALQGLRPGPTPTPLPPGVAPYDADPKRPGFSYDNSPSLGASEAPLVIVAFQDFKSADGAQFAKTIEPALREKYVNSKPGQLRLVMKFFPTAAPQAAGASLCAADQGKFWEYYDVLFARQAEWQDADKAKLTGYAKTLGLDEGKFQKCLESTPFQGQIDGDLELAQQLGIQKPPYLLLLNVQLQTGARLPTVSSVDQMDQAIQTALKGPKPTP